MTLLDLHVARTQMLCALIEPASWDCFRRFSKPGSPVTTNQFWVEANLRRTRGSLGISDSSERRERRTQLDIWKVAAVESSSEMMRWTMKRPLSMRQTISSLYRWQWCGFGGWASITAAYYRSIITSISTSSQSSLSQRNGNDSRRKFSRNQSARNEHKNNSSKAKIWHGLFAFL